MEYENQAQQIALHDMVLHHIMKEIILIKDWIFNLAGAILIIFVFLSFRK